MQTLFCEKHWLETDTIKSNGKVWKVQVTWICNHLTLAWTCSAPCTLSVYWIFKCRESIFCNLLFYFRSYSPFWDGKVCLESLPVYSLSPINMIESGTVKKISGWTFVSGDKPIRVCLCYIVFYYTGIHTEIYSLKSYVLDFYTQMSSFIHSFACSFVRSFVQSIIHSFIHSFIHACMCMHACMHPSIH